MPIRDLIPSLAVTTRTHEDRHLLTMLRDTGLESLKFGRIRLTQSIAYKRWIDQGGVELDYACPSCQLFTKKPSFVRLVGQAL